MFLWCRADGENTGHHEDLSAERLTRQFGHWLAGRGYLPQGTSAPQSSGGEDKLVLGQIDR
jgi:hypothetical protein